MNASEIHYKVRWRASGGFPGHHASQQKGAGLQFSHLAPLLDAPDPRRFDLPASLRDPFEQIQVRIFRQSSAIALYVIADLSASMNFVGAHAKMTVLSELVGCLSYSAYRTGDRFGFVGCAEDLRQDWLLPASINRAAGLELAARLREARADGRDSRGLLAAAEAIGRRRALVFLVSDFHFPLPLLEAVLASLAHHDVVPTVLWDRHEFEGLPRFGLARVSDGESGRSRLLLMRPALKRRIEEAFASQRVALDEVFARHGRAPLLLEDGFDADEVTHYFFG